MKKTLIILAVFVVAVVTFAMNNPSESEMGKTYLSEINQTEAITNKIIAAGPYATEITLTVGEFVEMKGYSTECQAVCDYVEGYSKWAAFSNHGNSGIDGVEIELMLLGNNSAPTDSWWRDMWDEYSLNCSNSSTTYYTIYLD